MVIAIAGIFFLVLAAAWCLLVIPALWLSGTISQAEEDPGPTNKDNTP